MLDTSDRRNLRFDRRLIERRGWGSPEELRRELESLPDVSDKIAGNEAASSPDEGVSEPNQDAEAQETAADAGAPPPSEEPVAKPDATAEHPDEPPTGADPQQLGVLKAHFGEQRYDAALRRLLGPVARRAPNPDAVTAAGALFCLGAGGALAGGALVGGAALIAAGGCCDLLDGFLARQRGSQSARGAFLDATLDRLGDIAILVGISVHFARMGSPGAVALAGATLAGAVLTSYIKARAEPYLDRFEGGLVERAERLLLLGVGALVDLLVPVLWILAALGAWTAAARFASAYRLLGRVGKTPFTGAGRTDPA